MEQLDFIRNAGETRRFHTWPVLRQQNVAEHSWHVAMLLFTMYGQDEPGIRLPLIMAGLTHDAAEWKVGDLPSPAKREMDKRLQIKGAQTFRSAWGQMEQDILKTVQLDWEEGLTPEELRALKLADTMEGALYCIRERAMGNALIVPCYMNFISYIGELEPASDIEKEIYEYITTQWSLANGD